MSFGHHDNIVHPFDRSSSKQRRVCYSSYDAKILESKFADEKGFNVNFVSSSALPDLDVLRQLFVNSKDIFDTLSTLHKGNDYRLHQTA